MNWDALLRDLDSTTADTEPNLPEMNWLLLKNSLLVGGLTTLLAASFGFAGGAVAGGLEGRWRHRLLAVAVMALALPPFLVTNCWLHFLGLRGRLARLAAAEHHFARRNGLDSEPADLADHAADGPERLAAAGAVATGKRHGGDAAGG